MIPPNVKYPEQETLRDRRQIPGAGGVANQERLSVGTEFFSGILKTRILK